MKKQASTAKYIIQQYIAATGGQAALLSVESMYAVGKIHMSASEFHAGMEDEGMRPKGNSEYGAFVLWQKNPEVWYFDFIMAGCKLIHGSDGQVAWKQSSIERSHVTPGPPRPLRRSLQVEFVLNGTHFLWKLILSATLISIINITNNMVALKSQCQKILPGIYSIPHFL